MFDLVVEVGMLETNILNQNFGCCFRQAVSVNLLISCGFS